MARFPLTAHLLMVRVIGIKREFSIFLIGNIVRWLKRIYVQLNKTQHLLLILITEYFLIFPFSASGVGLTLEQNIAVATGAFATLLSPILVLPNNTNRVQVIFTSILYLVLEPIISRFTSLLKVVTSHDMKSSFSCLV